MAVEIRHFKQDYQSLKREVSRLASMANKRLVRLENNGFEDSPAYKQIQCSREGLQRTAKRTCTGSAIRERENVNNSRCAKCVESYCGEYGRKLQGQGIVGASV